MPGLEELMAPYQAGDMRRNMPPPPRPTGALESLMGAILPQMDEQGNPQPPSWRSIAAAALMGLGRMPGSARVSNPVVPMRPYRPNTTFTGDPPSAANMNPPKNPQWVGDGDGLGYSFATDAQGRNMAGVLGQWNGKNYTYQPQIHAPVSGNATTNVHTGPQFGTREIAERYAEALAKSGKFGPKPDPAFAAPFLEQDAAALRQLMAEKARGGFSVVPGQ